MHHQRLKRVFTYVLCWLFATQPVWAGIQVDSNRQNNATLTSAGNGVPVLNIAAPNAQGLSHNQFEQYDVGQAGLILNNATDKLVQSQLAGYLQGNSQLNGQPASVILNEVTGANRSQLNGYTEVLGQQANVIVANPYGITCDGCGFINTSRATLTTGVPQFQNGLLSGFDIRQGDVTILGEGLDATGQDYFDILSRTAKINADIHANQLSIVTGPNQIDYLTNQVTATHDLKDKPLLAIDSSVLGGMYAGRISLVATEQGVGVNTGKLFSSVGDIQLSADGQITLGDVRSQQSLKVASNQSVTTTGTQQAGQQIEYTATDSLSLHSENSATRVQASAGQQIHQAGLINAGESASFEASEVLLTQAETSAQQIDIQSGTLAINQSTLTAGLTSDGSETGTGTLSIQVAEAILSDSAVQVSGHFNGEINQLTLDSSSVVAAEQAVLSDTARLNNDGQIRVKQGFTLASEQSLEFMGSGNVSADSLTVQANEIKNQSKLTAASEMTVEAETLINDGQLISHGQQHISAGTLSNQGALASAGAQAIDVTGQLRNTGDVQAAGEQSLSAAVFLQQGNVAGDKAIRVEAGSMIQEGTLVSLEDIRITADELTLNQAVTANQDVHLTVSGDLALNHELSAGGDAYVSAGGQLVNTGKLVAQGHTDVSAGGTLTNLAAGLISGQTTALNAHVLNNQGTIQALSNLMATLSQFINQGATLGMQDTTLNVTGNVSNTGLLYAGQTGAFYVKGELVNTEGDILTGGKMFIAADDSGALSKSVQNVSGVIQSGDDLDLKAEHIVNKRKVLEIEKSSGEGVQLDPHYNQAEFSVPRGYEFAPTYYWKESKGASGANGNSNIRYTLVVTGGTHLDFVTKNEVVTLKTASASAQMLAGKNLTVLGKNLENNASLISAANNSYFTLDSLENTGYALGGIKETAAYDYAYHRNLTRRTVKEFFFKRTSHDVQKFDQDFINSTISSGGNTVLHVQNKLNNSEIKSNTGAKSTGKPSQQAQQASGQTASGSQLSVIAGANSVEFPDFRLPTSPNGLFVLNNGPDSQYLIETNPALTNLDQFLGSDYFFDSIGFNPEKDLRVLGDAFYDTRTITTAIFEQTGKRYLNDDVGTDLAQMQQLLDNAGQQKHSLSLQAGVALTPEQVAGLTQDIVWWEPIEVQGQQVLAPKLYLSKVTQDHIDGGALISGAEVYAEAGNLVNSGQMDSRGKLHLVSDDSISNLGGSMTAGGDVVLDAVNDIQNISGEIAGDNVALTTQQGDIINRTDVERISITQAGTVTTADKASNVVYSETRVGDTATISGRGQVTMNAGGSIVNTAANVSAGDELSFIAEKDIILAAETARDAIKLSGREQRNVAVLGSSVSSGGNLSLDAGENIAVTASDMETKGKLAMVAGWDVALNTLVNESFSSENAGNRRSVSHLQQHQRTQMAANDGVFIQSGNNITATGSEITTQGDVVALAKGDITFQAVNDSEYHYEETTRKKSFGRKETHIQESLDETVVGADVTAGGKIIMKAQKYDDVQLAGGDSDITLIGANFKAEEGIEASADGGVGVYAQQYRTFNRDEKIKKGFGGLSGSHKSEIDSATLLNASGMLSSDTIDITSGKNIALIASEIEAGGDINASAVEEVIIAAGQESRQRETFEQEYGAFRGGDLFSMDSARQGETHNTAKGSALASGGTVNVKGGSVTVIGSDITAVADANFTADTGSVAVLAAEETHTTWSSTESLSVNLEDALKSVVNPYESVNFDDGQAKLTLAKADYEKSDSKTDATTHRGASIIGKGTVRMNAAEDILIEGSDVLADADEDGHGNIELTAANDVLIREVTDTQTTHSSNTKGEAELSLVVQHQAVETGKAAIALKESADKLKQANKDYRQYKKQLDNLEDTLSSLEQALANQAPGVNAADVDELKGIIRDVKRDEQFYLSTIALATADVASKTTLLMKQGAAAAQSTSTLGFDAGLHLDMSVTQTDSHSTSTTARGASLSGQNIVVKSGTQTDQQVLVQGSVLRAKEEVVLDGGTVNVVAAQQTQSGQSSTESGTINASITVHGSSTGGSLNASMNLSEQRSQSTTYVNSGVAGSTITINSRGDTHIKGANVEAEEALNLDIGGDLNVVSVQNRHSASNQGMGISGGASLNGGGDATGANGGLNASNGHSITSDTLLTTLTSGGTADVNVGGNTDIVGALIATVDENGNDLGNLALTTGSLTFRDLNNTDYRHDMSGGITSSTGVNAGEIDSTYNSTTLQYQNTSSYSKDKTLATLGQGEISIAEDSDLTALNRDTQNTNRDLFDVDRQQGNVDVTLDHRLLTEDGWQDIQEDVKRNELGLSSLADVVTQDSVSLGDTFEHIDNVQKNLDVQKLVASKDGGKYAVILNQLDSATGEEKQAAINAYAAAYAEVYHLDIESALVVAVTKVVNGAHYQSESGASQIVINDESMKNARDYMATLGHEVTHAQTAQGVLESRNKEQEEGYAHLMGGYSEDNYAFVLEIAGLGRVNEGDVNTHTGNQSSALLKSNWERVKTIPISQLDFEIVRDGGYGKLAQMLANHPASKDVTLSQMNDALDEMVQVMTYGAMANSPASSYYKMDYALEKLEQHGTSSEVLKVLKDYQSQISDFVIGPDDEQREAFAQSVQSMMTLGVSDLLRDPSGSERVNAIKETWDNAFMAAGAPSAGLGLAQLGGDIARVLTSKGIVLQNSSDLLAAAKSWGIDVTSASKSEVDDLYREYAKTTENLIPPKGYISSKQEVDFSNKLQTPDVPEAESVFVKQDGQKDNFGNVLEVSIENVPTK